VKGDAEAMRNAWGAVVDDDLDSARRIVRDMTDMDLRVVVALCRILSIFAAEERERRNDDGR